MYRNLAAVFKTFDIKILKKEHFKQELNDFKHDSNFMW